MNVLLTATALLGLGLSAAQPAASGWPQGSCLHGTTINDTGRTLNLRALEGEIRKLIHQAGVAPAPTCSTYLNVLVHAEPLGPQTIRMTAHLVLAEREVTLNEVTRKAPAFGCRRTVTEIVHPHEDFFTSSQAVIKRLLAEAPQCTV
ncbi:hypothetical protein GCM10008955_38450 [Deinococcus malanensis]|uniref:Uncharacterized protein n=1 Tax=Deinococcus malanensis TaxID=1706855 RepID=A0ABQ2F4B5_9DEIO|nr:hypothetical protein [Deinococcus malanensis]GGK40973.1 hypothetical protein GCM10008955_38450 [Deinococcus malanensis]